jgi:predicted small secreted protein
MRMKRHLLAVIAVLVLLVAACTPPGGAGSDAPTASPADGSETSAPATSSDPYDY